MRRRKWRSLRWDLLMSKPPCRRMLTDRRSKRSDSTASSQGSLSTPPFFQSSRSVPQGGSPSETQETTSELSKAEENGRRALTFSGPLCQTSFYISPPLSRPADESVVDPTVPEPTAARCQSPEEDATAEAAATAEQAAAASQTQSFSQDAASTGSPDTDSPVMINVDVSTDPMDRLQVSLQLALTLVGSWLQEMGSGNTSHKSDEEDFVKVDDVPLPLTVMCEVPD